MIIADIYSAALTTLFVVDLVLILIGLVVYLALTIRRGRRRHPGKDIEEMSQEIANLSARNLELRKQLKDKKE